MTTQTVTYLILGRS